MFAIRSLETSLWLLDHRILNHSWMDCFSFMVPRCAQYLVFGNQLGSAHRSNFGVIIRHNKKHSSKFRREGRLRIFYFKPSLNFGPQINLVLSSNQRQGKIVELWKVQIVFMVLSLTKMLIKTIYPVSWKVFVGQFSLPRK